MKRVKIKGISPETVEHYWNGTGWVDKTRKTYTQSEADRMLRRINIEHEFCAWTEAA